MTEPWESDFSLSFSSYEFDKLDMVASVPGVYAWYSKILIPAFDVKEELNDTKIDSGALNLFNYVRSEIDSLSPSDLSVGVGSSFGQRWNGFVNEGSRQKWLENLDQNLLEKDLLDDASRLDQEGPNIWVTNEHQARQMIAYCFKNSVSSLAAPIYIGVSDNLSTRLLEHQRKIDDLDGQNPDSVQLEKLRQGGEFAERVIGAGLKPNKLMVKTFEVKVINKALENQEIAHGVCRFIEWSLNRLYHPKLGRY